MSFTFPTITALGTSWWIEVFDEVDKERRTVIHHDCTAFLRTFEDNYSRFKPNSYVSTLTTTGHVEAPTAEFCELLTFGLKQYDRTRGVFNIMVGSKLVETGYDAAYSFTPTTAQTPIPNPHDVLHISPDRITLDRGQLDIGGFGKGYAIDALTQLLQEQHGLQFFLINGGGDMYATSDYGTPVTIYLEHPTDAQTYLTTTTLLNQGFAASSPHKRSWTHKGSTYTHIIDTLKQGIDITTRPDATFIKATTACDADIFATVALLVSTEMMAAFAASEQLGVASFFLRDSSLTHNQAFL